MRINKLGLLSLLMGIMLLCITQLAASEKRKAPAPGDVEKELEKLEADWAAAVETNDPAKIERFFTADFLFVGAGGILQDRKQHLDDFRSGKLKVKLVKIEDKVIHVYQNSAVVSAKVIVEGKFGDRDISGPYQFTDTWVKQGTRWLSAARQQTAIAKASRR